MLLVCCHAACFASRAARACCPALMGWGWVGVAPALLVQGGFSTAPASAEAAPSCWCGTADLAEKEGPRGCEGFPAWDAFGARAFPAGDQGVPGAACKGLVVVFVGALCGDFFIADMTEGA